MHQLSFYPRNAVVLSKLKPCNPPEFSYIKNMLKDQLVKTSAFHFDKWVSRARTVSGTEQAPDLYYR